MSVAIPGASLDREEEECREAAEKLTAELGGNFRVLEGDSAADEIARYLNETGANLLVLGETAQSRWSEIWKGSFINRISRQVHKVDIVVIATDSQERNFFEEEE